MACKRTAEPTKSQCQPSDALGKGEMHFFKIMLDSVIQEKKLMIPPKFARKYGDDLSAVATLSVANGRVWRVGLTKAENSIYFHDGWHEFVEFYSIRHGHFLVFSYKGISNFHVLIFDMTACEINYPFNGSSGEQGPHRDRQYPDLSEGEMEDDDSVESLGLMTPLEEGVFNKSSKDKTKDNSKHPNKNAETLQAPVHDSGIQINRSKINTITCRYGHIHSEFNEVEHAKMAEVASANKKAKSREHELFAKSEDGVEVIVSKKISRYSKTSQERESAIHAAKLFKPKNPSFMVILNPYSFSGSTLCVPFAFATKYLSRDSKYLTLQDSDGREWPVRIKFRHAYGVNFKKGWSEFCRANNLEEGDVCIFELIKTDCVVLKVSIFHVSSE